MCMTSKASKTHLKDLFSHLHKHLYNTGPHCFDPSKAVPHNPMWNKKRLHDEVFKGPTWLGLFRLWCTVHGQLDLAGTSVRQDKARQFFLNSVHTQTQVNVLYIDIGEQHNIYI